jgi:hypothetical protein
MDDRRDPYAEFHESVRALGRELDKALHLTQFVSWLARRLAK